MTWKWDENVGNYRDDVTGQLLTRTDALDLVDQSLDASVDVTGDLALLASLSAAAAANWNSQMREELKREYVRQYVLGRGGLPQMTPDDWDSIGGTLAEQYGFLDAMSEEIAQGLIPEALIIIRSGMYIHSAREAYNRGKASGKGLDFGALPAYPGDGSTDCLTNDNCDWDIQIVRDDDGNIIRWECFWRLQPGSRHCNTCLSNAQAWNPFIIEA